MKSKGTLILVELWLLCPIRMVLDVCDCVHRCVQMCVFSLHIIRRLCWRAATGSEGLRWWSRSITSGGSTTRRGWALLFLTPCFKSREWIQTLFRHNQLIVDIRLDLEKLTVITHPSQFACELYYSGCKNQTHHSYYDLFFRKLAFVLLVLQSSSFCRIRSWNNHSFIDQSEMLHTVSLVFCSFRERRMISSPSCTRYDKRSSLIFWPLKCGFDQLTQIPLWVFALFLCRSSGKSNQLLFLAYWFSLSQPTGGIKKWNVQHNLRYSLQFIGNWHILVAADDNTAEICIV